MKGKSRAGLLGALLLVTALLLLPATALAQGNVPLNVGVNLDPVGGSGVSGTALLVPSGTGTNVTLEVKGLPAGAQAAAESNAGTCAQPSASFVALPNLKADSTGKATATGSILFHGTDPVSIENIADGQHTISIKTDKVVACGVIPSLAAVSGPAQMPATGGAAGPDPAVIALALGALGLALLSGGLLVIRRMRG